MDLNNIKRVHFIGIGGIGISAIARMFLQEAKVVTGSDRDDSLVVKEVKKLGAKVVIGQKAENIKKGTELVVYSPSISDSNSELKQARKFGIPTFSYPEMLGIISKEKFTIAIAGTHGKTTTTAMTGKVLIDAGLNPTMIVGSLVKDKAGKLTNFIPGDSKYFVVEACEYKRSFLNINPKIVVITNIDNDHLDYYKDLKDIQKAFSEFVAKLPADGYLICDTADKRLQSIIKKAKCRVINYGTEQSSKLKLKVPGEHNQQNARAALAVAKILKINSKKAIAALEGFTGTWRRFEYRGKSKSGALLYDDYGHHPTEIKANLKGARELAGDKRVFVVFQPHLFSRTKLLLNDFAKSFAEADQVIVTDIYAARERDDATIHSQDLVNLINRQSGNALYMKGFKDIAKFINNESRPGELVILQGAGDVVKLGEIC